MNHYFTEQNQSPINRREIPFRFFGLDFNLVSSDAIFSKKLIDKGTLVLLEYVIKDGLKGTVLDLGCGIGVVGIALKKKFPELKISLSDVTSHAVELAQENIKAQGLEMDVILSDGFANIPVQFDSILLNPPIRAGKAVIYRLFEESLEHLKANGKLYIVMMKKHGLDSAIRFFESKNTKVTKLGHRSNYHVLKIEK